MKAAGVSFDRVPALHVPLRFFLVAPWYGVAAGILLWAGGSAGWSSRWTPTVLAATHLLTLGTLSMVMVGALFQLVPVLTGRPVPAERWTAPMAHAGLVLGTAALAAGLHSQLAGWFVAAGVGLGVGFGAPLTALAWLLLRPVGGGVAVFAMRLALAALAVAVAVGLYLALGRAAPSLGIPFRAWTDAHAIFGLGGWIVLLVMAIGFQVIPMFHVAPDFPAWPSRAVATGLFVALATVVVGGDVVRAAAVTAAAILVALWAVAVVVVLSRRKRRRRDAMIGFWHLALAALLAAVALSWAYVCVPGALPHAWVDRAPLLIGVLSIAGFGLSAVVGMQHKIIAFLVFMHLQRRCLAQPAAARHLPNMAGIVPERRARRQLVLHAGALVVLLAAASWPEVGPWAGLLLALDLAHLGVTQLGAVRRGVAAARAMLQATSPTAASRPGVSSAPTE